MATRSLPPGERPRRRLRWLRQFRKVSLRARLTTAFILLIITSASATIAIGNIVFGRKVVELASSKMEVGLRVAEQGLAARLERMLLSARMEAERLRPGEPLQPLCKTALRERDLLDFVLVAAPAGWQGLRLGAPPPAATGGAAAPAAPPACTPFALTSAPPGELGRFVARAAPSGRPLSGLLALDRASMARLQYRDPPPEGLFLAVAVPLGDGAVLVMGALLNGRNDLVAAPVNLLWPEHRQGYAATLFLRGTRVATTMDAASVGTHVDPEVERQVLEEGRRYAGSTTVIDHTYYTAYMPLRDYRGVPVGILGIGAREEVYADMQSQTVTLFSALIAIGMVFGFVMTYFFSVWLIRPVAELAQGMNRVAGGDLDHKVRIAAADELGRLAQAFNLMVKAIRERDIQLKAMTEERLSQVEKQVSIGRLAAGVAHEINNPLTSVLSLTMLMQRALAPDDPRREDLEIIVEETKRCRQIVRNLLDFARERTTERRVLDLNQVVRETLVLTSKYDGMERIRTVLELAEEPLLVNGDALQLQQVFTNIIINAAEATGQRGKIFISTDEDSSGAFVVAKVGDRGRGIPKESLARIFEPFFTTKDPGKGTGLGLSVSLGIVRKHDGTIEVESAEGEGTTVTVMLPRVTAAPEATP